jgi:hypothetical protein
VTAAVRSTASDARLSDALSDEEHRGSTAAASRVWTPRWLPPYRAARWGYRAALFALLLLIVHGLAVNVLLLGGSLNRMLERGAGGVIKIDTGKSFSLWPGLVQLRQLHLDIIDSNVHLEIIVPSGSTKIRLHELLSRRFSTSSIEGEHFIVRLRPRFEQLSERRRAALPPLEDGQDKGGQPKPSELWGVALAGIDAQFDELWISELRHRGSAHVEGGFELQPLEKLEIHPSRVVLGPGRLTYGPEEPVLSVEHIQLDASLPETTVDELGSSWRERLTVALDAAGQVDDVRFVEALAPVAAGLSGGRGQLKVMGRAEQGRWVGDLLVDYRTDTLQYARGANQGHAAVRVGVHAGEQSELIATDTAVEGVVLANGQDRLASLSKAQIDGVLTRRFPFPEPEDARFALEGLALDGLEALRALEVLPPALKPRGGSILAHAAMRWHEGRITGSAHASLKELGFGYGDWTFQQSGRVDLTGLSWKAPHSALRLKRALVELHDVRLQHPDAKVDSWDLVLDCEDVRFNPDASMARARFLLRSDDAKPALVLMGVRGLPPGLDEFLAMPQLRVIGKLALGKDEQELNVERAESETIDVRGRFVRQRDENQAALLFKAMPLSLGVSVHGKESGFKLFAGDSWLERELGRLPRVGGSVARSTPAPRRSASPEAASLAAKKPDERAPE